MATLRFVRIPATRSRRRCVLAVVAVTHAVAAAPAVAAPGIEVAFPDRTQLVTGEQIASSADVVATPYVIRGPSGERTETPAAGVSVRTLIALAGGDPDSVAGVSVTRADGTTVALQSSELADPPPFPEGPPLFWVDEAGSHFLRPVRGATDANETDRVTIAGDAPVVVNVQAGALLEVTAGADRERIEAGQVVRFWASAIGGTSGEELSYRWHFDDGTTGRGAEIKHVYRRPGRYRAYVTVSGSGRSGGTSAVITIQVGEQEKPDAPAADDGGGGTGAAGGGTAGGGGAGEAAGGATGAAGAASGSQRSGGDGERRRPKPKPRRRRREAPEPKPAGTRIEGTLIGEEMPPAALAARPEARPAERPDGDGNAPVALWGALGAGGLVAAGALMERMPMRRRLVA
jgi:PKD domain